MKPAILCRADFKFEHNMPAFRRAFRKECEKEAVTNGIPKKHWREMPGMVARFFGVNLTRYKK